MTATPSFNNARTRFITATTSVTCLDLLIQHLPDTLSAELILRSGGVWHNKHRILDPHYRLHPKDTVKVYISPVQGTVFTLLDDHIIYKDEHVLIVNKPAGITSVADRSSITNNMTYGVQQYLQRQGHAYQPTPITRLDFMVSGLMLFATHKQAEKELFALSQQRAIKKYYIARLHTCDPTPSCLRIKDNLTFTNKCRVSQDGKPSESLFIHRESTPDYEEYGVVLLTGRRHQIRCHAAHYLAPLLEDSLYGKANVVDPKPIALWSYGLNMRAFGKRYKFRLLSI